MRGHSQKLKAPSKSQSSGKIKKLYNNGASDFIGEQPGDILPILYLSGSTGAHGVTEAKLSEVSGSKCRCFSFAYTGKESPVYARTQAKALEFCLSNGYRVFLDSGGHTFHNFRYKDWGMGKLKLTNLSRGDRIKALDKIMRHFLEAYAQYVIKGYQEGYKYDFYVTFDAERRCSLIRELTDELFKLGIFPVPVYHGDASLDYVRRYIDDGHKLIGVGTSLEGKRNKIARQRYYASVIELCAKHGVKCHGFAITGDMMFQFPWYSVDSTTWLKCAAYGKIIEVLPERQRVSTLHVSDRFVNQNYGSMEQLSPNVQKRIINNVEAQGFEWEKVRTDLGYRAMYNARQFVLALEANAKKPPSLITWKSVI